MSTVLVQNVSPQADEAALRDFFGFCGDVERIELVKASESETDTAECVMEALVHFSDENDASTAQLLSDSLLVDRPVTITPVPKGGIPPSTAPASKPVEAKPVPKNKKPHEEKGPVNERKEVEETMKTEGGGAAKEGAGNAGQEQAHSGVLDSVMQKASELKAKVEEEGGVRQSVTNRLTKLNEEHHITDKLAEVRAKTSAAANKVMASESVQRGWGYLWNGISQLKDAAIKAEAANREFNSKLLREAKGRHSPRGGRAEAEGGAAGEGQDSNVWQAPDVDGENTDVNTAKSGGSVEGSGEEGGKAKQSEEAEQGSAVGEGKVDKKSK